MNTTNYRNRTSQLEILELASEYSEDEFGNTTHVFETPIAKVILERCWLDGDTCLSVLHPLQEMPIVKIDLVACEEIRVVDDKRGRYFEFVGQARVEEYSRGTNRKTLGFRVYLAPFVSVEPFFQSEPIMTGERHFAMALHSRRQEKEQQMADSTKDTKECIMCFKRIDGRAKKCHHCSAPQAKWANLDGNPWALGMAGLIMLAVIANLLFSTLWQPRFKEHVGELSASVTRLDVTGASGSQTVSCFGMIANTSKYDWSDFQFEARLYDAKGNFLDTFSATQPALRVSAGSKTAFRVHGTAAFPESQYRRCEVLIKHASPAR